MGYIWDIFAHAAFFNDMSLCSLMLLVSLARLNSMPVAVLQKLRPNPPNPEALPSQVALLQRAGAAAIKLLFRPPVKKV